MSKGINGREDLNMLVGSGLTICGACGLVVPVINGFCELCGEVFSPATLQAHVAEIEFELEAA